MQIQERPRAPLTFQLLQIVGLVLLAFLSGACIIPFMVFTNHVCYEENKGEKMKIYDLCRCTLKES